MDDDYEAADYPIPPDFDDYVQSEAFDRQCVADFRSLKASDLDDSNAQSASLRAFYSPTTSNLSSVKPSPHDPSPLEAKYYYYFGYRSNGRISCPKLVFRTSKDIWVPPTGAHAYPREMKLCNIPGDHKLAKNPTLWDPLRNQVVGLLDARDCLFTSVELVSFTWVEEKDEEEEGEEEENEDKDEDEGEEDNKDKEENESEEKNESSGEDEDEDDEDALAAAFDSMPPIQDVEERHYTTPPTIWVGVLPDTLSGAAANDLATEILKIVGRHNLTGVDIAFRESVA